MRIVDLHGHVLSELSHHVSPERGHKSRANVFFHSQRNFDHAIIVGLFLSKFMFSLGNRNHPRFLVLSIFLKTLDKSLSRNESRIAQDSQDSTMLHDVVKYVYTDFQKNFRRDAPRRLHDILFPRGGN
jgi:hypothetical protein